MDNNDNLSSFINFIKKARKFAENAHKGQKRKMGEDYIIHPQSVAKIVHKVKKSKKIADLIAAAYLHDTVEDNQEITFDIIKSEFGDLVMNLVKELTSDKEKIKIIGKEEYLIDKMIQMSNWALVIKLSDRLHNLKDMLNLSNNDNYKEWIKEYSKQTTNIIEELKWYRNLSKTQLLLIEDIKKELEKINNKA